MAQLGRAQAAVVAAIGVLLTANMSFLYADAVGTESRIARHVARASATAEDKPQGYVIFGKADSPIGTPTVFAARADGGDLAPSSHAPRRDQALRKLDNGTGAVLSHDRTRYVTTGRDVWILPVGGGARKLTDNVTSAAPRDPVWSPDDTYVAFVWRGNIVVMRADGDHASIAYRAPGDSDSTEYVSLFGWTANAPKAST